MKPTPLHQALAAHLGQELTPEVAARIVLLATDSLDMSIDPNRFPPIEHDGIRLAVERFDRVLPELHPMHLAHWDETERHQAGVPLLPDYDALLFSTHTGGLIQFTARKDGQLIGHLRLYLKVSRHSGLLFAHEDTLYVTPENRGGILGLKLMRYAERALVDVLGVREIRFDSKTINNADVLARRLRYQPVATQFVKTFPGA